MSEHDARCRIMGTVLVADDHAIFRFGLVRYLSVTCAVSACHEAECFDDALELLADPAVTLAIFDLDMPGLASPGDLERVRRQRPDIRLVVLTGTTDRNTILEVLAAGAHGYLIKSEPLERMIDRLAYVLAGEIFVPALVAELPCEPRAEPARGGTLRARLPRVARTRDPLSAKPVGPSLSDRQIQVLQGIIEGKSNKQIAGHLEIAEGTVKMHVGALYRALGASNRAHAASLGKRLLE